MLAVSQAGERMRDGISAVRKVWQRGLPCGFGRLCDRPSPREAGRFGLLSCTSSFPRMLRPTGVSAAVSRFDRSERCDESHVPTGLLLWRKFLPVFLPDTAAVRVLSVCRICRPVSFSVFNTAPGLFSPDFFLRGIGAGG